jgi:hypothetical protein
MRPLPFFIIPLIALPLRIYMKHLDSVKSILVILLYQLTRVLSSLPPARPGTDLRAHYRTSNVRRVKYSHA